MTGNAVRFVKITEFCGGISSDKIVQFILIEFSVASATWRPEAAASPRLTYSYATAGG